MGGVNVDPGEGAQAGGEALAHGLDLALLREVDSQKPADKRALARGRTAQRNLDLQLRKVKRVKRLGMPLLILGVLFGGFGVAPISWVAAYMFFDPPATALMLSRAAEGARIRHEPVPLSAVSPHVVRAVIAAEDANFCSHHGFDFEAIRDAAERNADGGRLRGASTISQQTAKNLFLWPDRSWIRKGLETYFTALIETLWSKRRIMAAYLNVAEWGDGVFGIEAAARARFGVSASQLSPMQAARLAAVLPSPNTWRADRPGPYVRARAAQTRARRRERGAGRVRAGALSGRPLRPARPS
jgi:monofunctional biosynthetic peptidoglycan transglycosylase